MNTAKNGHMPHLLLRAAELAVLALAVFWIVKAIITFITPERAWSVADSAPAPSVAGQTQTPAVKYDFSFDVFNRDAPEAVVVTDVVEGEDAPETTLSLKLKGHFAGPEGRAVLELPDRTQRSFSVGDEVIDGVTLKSVSPGFIVLSQNGRLERLTFERGETAGLKKIDAAVARAPIINGVSMTDFLKGMNPVPVRNRDGRVTGYRLTARNGFNLQSVGLQNGDIITHIGEEDLRQGNPEWGSLYNDLIKTKGGSFRVMRGGNAVTVRVDLQ